MDGSRVDGGYVHTMLCLCSVSVMLSLLMLATGCAAPVSSLFAKPTMVPAAEDQFLSSPVKMRVGVIGLNGEIGMFLAQERGYFQDEGLEVEFVQFRSAAEALPALASGELALGSGAPEPSVFNATRRDVGVKLIGSLSIVKPGDAGAALMIRQDHIDSGRYRELSDLKGMNIAIHILGTTPQLYMERVLARAGLTMDDVQFSIVQIPDQVSALANKAVDAAWAIDPFVTLIEMQGLGKRVITVSDVFPGAVSMIIMLSPVFERRHPEAVKRFAVAYLRGARDYIQASKTNQGREEMIPIMVKYTGVKDPTLYARLSWPNLDPNSALDPQVLDIMQDYFVKAGTQQEKQDINRVIDPSYMNYAIERLGSMISW